MNAVEQDYLKEVLEGTSSKSKADDKSKHDVQVLKVNGEILGMFGLPNDDIFSLQLENSIENYEELRAKAGELEKNIYAVNCDIMQSLFAVYLIFFLY